MYHDSDSNLYEVQALVKLSERLGGLTIMRKSAIDMIGNTEELLFSTTGGTPRRCGGQGDILSGLVLSCFSLL